MPTRRPEVGLGDWIRVMAELPKVMAKEQILIASCLGLQTDSVKNKHLSLSKQKAWRRHPHKPKADASPTNTEQPTVNKSKTGNNTPSPIAKTPNVPTTGSQPELPDEIIPIRIEKLPNTLKGGLSPLLKTNFSHQKPLELNESNHSSVLRFTLFPQSTVRGLLIASVAQSSPGHCLDISSLIQASVQCRPLRSLPLIPRLSTQRGCQLLLDFNEGLVPWWDDMHDLIQQFQSVLGENSCPVYEFTDKPSNAVRWTEAGEQSWKAIAGTPVVIASDFGQSSTNRHESRSGLSAWRDFALHCQRWQVPLIALTPLGHKRMPKELMNLMSIVDWNPHTRASEVKRVISYKGGIPK